jgi:peptidoglycan-N-acetylglucosamine deacetylase
MIEAWDALLATDGYACMTLHPRANLGIGRAARITMIERLFERARRLGSGFRLCREVAAESGQQFGSGTASGAA